MREIARAAYRAGARIVEPTYVDRHFTRALIELGPDESLDYTPPWALNMLSSLEAEKGAFIQVSGDPEPELLADLPGDRVGRALPRELQAQWTRMVSERVVTWTIVPARTQAWALQVFGEPDVEALWDRDREGGPARPSGSCHGVAGSHREVGGDRRRAQRKALRLSPLSRTRHRLHGRTAGQLAMRRCGH